MLLSTSVMLRVLPLNSASVGCAKCFNLHTKSDWWARIRDIEKQRQRLNLPSGQCVVIGLPAFSGK